jgi:hypothetical protein
MDIRVAKSGGQGARVEDAIISDYITVCKCESVGSLYADSRKITGLCHYGRIKAKYNKFTLPAQTVF